METTTMGYMGDCQNYGPFLCTLDIRCRIMIGTPKRDHNFDNHPHAYEYHQPWYNGFGLGFRHLGLGLTGLGLRLRI